MRTFIFTDSAANGDNGFQLIAGATKLPEIHSDMNPPGTIKFIPGNDPFTNMQCQNLESNKIGLVDKGIMRITDTTDATAGTDGDYYTAEVDGDYTALLPAPGLAGVAKGDIIMTDGTTWKIGGYKTDFSDVFPPQVATPRDPITGKEQSTGIDWLRAFAYKNRLEAKEVAVPTFEIAVGEKDEKPAPAQEVDLPFIADLAMTDHDLAFETAVASKAEVVFTGGAPPFMFTLDTPPVLPAGFTFDAETGEFIYDGTGTTADTGMKVAIDDGVTNTKAVVTLKVA